MRFVRIAAFVSISSSCRATVIEAVVIFRSAVEVELEAVEFACIFRERHGIIWLPVRQVLIDAVDFVEHRLKHWMRRSDTSPPKDRPGAALWRSRSQTGPDASRIFRAP